MLGNRHNIDTLPNKYNIYTLTNKYNIYTLPNKYNIYTLTKGGHQESNLEATLTEDGDPHQHPPQVP
jgi:hypothetical protein